MPCDALTYFHIANELDSALIEGRIERIGMPSPSEVILSVRPKTSQKRESQLLLLCCNNTRPRIQITKNDSENPLSAFSFLMHLRKHIGGGVIKKIRSIKRERIIEIFIDAFDELGYKKEYCLFVELMGRYSNLILTDGNGVITDCLKHIGFDNFSERALLPGIKYALPPKPESKFSPDEKEKFSEALLSFEEGNLADYLMRFIYGYAPTTMKEAVYSVFSTLSPTKDEVKSNVNETINALLSLDTAYSPCIIVRDGKPADYFFKPFSVVAGEYIPFPTISEAMDEYYSGVEEYGYLAGKTAKLLQTLKSAIKKNQKSLSILKERLIDSSSYEEDRIFGELLTANLYAIKQGYKEITVDNYYTGEKVTIILDEKLSPQKNAQNYFKAYSKKKTAIAKTEEQIIINEEKTDYYESILASLSSAENESDIAEITAEMENAGLIAKSKQRKKNKKATPITLTVDGFTVYIGKNNIQNDTLVRSSNGGWLWLHAQKIHGSHGIIAGTSVPQDTINKVASFVAHYSKASLSANVPVDYTLVKFVKKPSGSPPGKVIYTHQQTVNVLPKKP